MARGGRATFTMDLSDFNRMMQVSISKVQRGTKRATIAALEEIGEASQKQVPRDTEALANSMYTEIQGSYVNFTGIIGYGRGANNPKTGQPTADYMIEVHEDLSKHHPVGKAKFLEDPVKDFQNKMGAKAAQFIKEELGG